MTGHNSRALVITAVVGFLAFCAIVFVLAGCSSSSTAPVPPPPVKQVCSLLCGGHWMGYVPGFYKFDTLTFAAQNAPDPQSAEVVYTGYLGPDSVSSTRAPIYAAIPFSARDSVHIGVDAANLSGVFVTPDSIAGTAQWRDPGGFVYAPFHLARH